MNFLDRLRRAREALAQNGRLSLRALERELGTGGEELDELVEELVDVQRVAIREDRILVWAGATGPGSTSVAEASPEQPAFAPRPSIATHYAAKIRQARAAVQGERKQVTVLFADVKGSMDLAERMDPEEWSAIMQRFFRILAEGVERFEGFVDKFTGDGIMALFGAPIAHEDHAQRACYAALHLRDQLASYATEVVGSPGTELEFAL